MRLIEFHRLGIGFEEPNIAVYVYPQIHGHLAKRKFASPFNLLGDHHSGLLHPNEQAPGLFCPESTDEQLLRVFDTAPARNVGRNAAGARNTRPDAGKIPLPEPVLLHQRTQVEPPVMERGQLYALLGNIASPELCFLMRDHRLLMLAQR